MANIILPKKWRLSEKSVTPEEVFWNRRKFVKALGLSGLSIATFLSGTSLLGCGLKKDKLDPKAGPSGGVFEDPTDDLYPAKKNKKFLVEPLTPEKVAASYNNFYEFFPDKENVVKNSKNFQIRPWQVKVHGLVENPKTYDIDDLIRAFPLEERVYRFRCVEAWAMVVPWTGFPLSALIKAVMPKSSAKFVRFKSFLNPDQAPGQKMQPWYNWPYYEGLRMDEAMHELTMAVTGIYGHPMPKQHGAPIRIITPWKYGYKSIKSVVEIEFVKNQPRTLWNDLAPDEYSFESNVNPKVPHPRWSQATERLIDTGQRQDTLVYNGYGDSVAKLYS